MGNGRASFEMVIRHPSLINIQYLGEKLFAHWRIVLLEDGSLVSIENTKKVEDGGEYELLFWQFINTVLQQVLAEKTQIFSVETTSPRY